MSNRIKKTEVYENRFYRIPKAFFKTEKYKKLSLYAKVIYGFLDDRRELSLKNNWVDEEDNIYLIFTRKEIQEMLCLSDKTVTNAFKELNDYGLIEEERQGLNKPNLIYVCHIDFTNIENMRTRKIYDSRTGEITNQEPENLRSIDTDLSKTNSKETEEVYVTLNEDDNLFFKIYDFNYQKKFEKPHMRIKYINYLELEEWVTDLIEYGINTEYWAEGVEDHFSHLSATNNGNILSFMASSIRYFEVPSPAQKEQREVLNKKYGNG